MNNPELPQSQEQLLMSQLREILLKEDRHTLTELQRILDDKTLLSGRINPIIEEHFDYLKQNFPSEHAKVVNRLIEQKLKDSQEEIIAVIYPVLGKMITKFINLQFQLLKEQIDAQMKNVFSSKGMVLQLKNKILGLKTSDTLLAAVDEPVLEEIFVIQRDTGLLVGSAALYPSVDRDVVAGMLSAIKAFVEDAFERDNKEDLESIQYGTYRILIQNFPSNFFAIAMSGSVSTAESEFFRNQIIDFIQISDDLRQTEIDGEMQERISLQLENHFIIPQRNKMTTLRLKSTTN